ncbi:zinc ribbon domain-containing protein [Streptomyces sp. NPDC096132]|uniref:zinc ribbon domain-containing protein n=1 Tax=Streptomyces sp. NPDC096132 TaxID=3366075 RepID=UPI00381FB890
MLTYKAVKHGRTFAKVDRTFPSSQVCSACGFRDGHKPLYVQKWTCRECGTVHDRDHNAARNVLFEGRRIVASALKQEAPGRAARPGRNPWTLVQGARQRRPTTECRRRTACGRCGGVSRGRPARRSR